MLLVNTLVDGASHPRSKSKEKALIRKHGRREETTISPVPSAPPLKHNHNVQAKEKLLSSARMGQLENQLREAPVYLRNSFIDCDISNTDFEAPTPRSCFSEPWSEKASINESLLIADYATTLRARAASLSKASQSGMATNHVAVEEPRQSVPHYFRNVTSTMSAFPSRRRKHSFDTISSFSWDNANESGHGANAVVSGSPSLRRRHSFDTISWFSRNDENEGSGGSGYPATQPGTTLMLCNLPCRLSPAKLMNLVDQLGFAGMYESVHAPRGAKTYKGYAFINFKEPEVVPRFSRAFSNYTFPGSSKTPYCKPAARQGSLRKTFINP